MDHTKQIDSAIAQHESRVQKLRAIQQLLADDPSLADELRAILLPKPAKAEASAFDRVVAFLQGKGDGWVTAREITRETGLPRNTVNSLLFASRQKDRFESRMEGPKKKVWRLRDDSIRLPAKQKAKEPKMIA